MLPMKTRVLILTGILLTASILLIDRRRESSHLTPKLAPVAHPQASDVNPETIRRPALKTHATGAHEKNAIQDWREEFQVLLQGSLSAALHWLEHSCLHERRGEAISLLADYWMKVSPEEALLGADQIKDRRLRHDYLNALARFPELDLETSIRLTESIMAYPNIMRPWTEAVVGRWQQIDLPKVLEWSERSGMELSALILIQALPFWAKTDPTAAARYHDSAAVKLPYDTKRQIGIEWARADGEAALAWLSTLSDPLQKEVAIRTALMAYAEKNPQKAVNYALGLPSKNDQLGACIGIAETLAKTDPQIAAQWITKFPPGEAYDKAVFTVFREYAKQDLKSTGAWIFQLPHTPVRDKALGEYVQELEHRFPAVAVEWALHITDGAERARRLRNALEAWTRLDPTAAATWKRTAQSTAGSP